MIILLVESGPDKGKKLPIKGDRAVVTCGRQDGVSLVLRDALVSSKHFQIRKHGEDLTLEDLNSTNGTLLNGDPVTAAPLQEGDVIQVGETYISIIEGEEADNQQRIQKDREISGYVLEERIGIGGNGAVFRARQKTLDRIVALKVLSPKLTRDRTLVDRFLSEARAAGRLTHANVVQVHDAGEENGVYFISMEYIDSGSLADLLREKGGIDAGTAVRIALDVARGLQYAESKNIVHCDIKPENIMLTGSGMAKIADLGIARHMAEEESGGMLEEVMGSPHYMSPEQAQGRPVDCRSDLYSLGCTLYRALAGRTPFTGGSSREIMKKQVFEEPTDIAELIPDVDSELADIVRGLMRKNPNDRFQSAAGLVESLEEWVTQHENEEYGEAENADAEERPATPKPRFAPRPAAGAGQFRSTIRIRRQRSSSSSLIFLPLAAVGIFVAFLIFAGMDVFTPDPGLADLRRARRYMNAGEYDRALHVLDNSSPRTKEVGSKLFALRKKCFRLANEQRRKGAFEQNWQDYQGLKNRGVAPVELMKRLEALLEQFGDQPEWRRRIEDEMSMLR